MVTAYAVAMELRFDASIPPTYASQFRQALPGVLAIHLGANAAFRVYSRVWRYAGLPDALALGWATAGATGLVLLADAALFPLSHPLPLTVVPVGGLLSLLGMALWRFRHRLFQEMVVAFTRPPRSRLLIVGAGRAGQRLARELLSTPSLGYEPVCFVDDDPQKQGRRIHGLVVAGPCHEVGRLVDELEIEVVAFAIPSLLGEARRELLARCEATSARVKILPGLPDLLTVQPSETLFRDMRLEDLLARPTVDFPDGWQDGWERQSVLITGAAGSIGEELARQLAATGCRRLILLDIDESGLFELGVRLEGAQRQGGPAVELVVADITRPERVAAAFERHRPTVVFHAAAYKHVPLLESHPVEAVLTNILGTLAVFEAAERAGCERVVFVSTDKAVAPTSVMGATKRVGELLVGAFGGGQTVYCAVRFGNVLGSRGSVVPIFLRQIRQGGPVTITHRDMARYFMTIPEAVNLIIAASAQARGGEVFILDMGQPVSIVELARKMIRLHGLRPGRDIEIREIGVRPGEKLREALIGAEEKLLPTRHPRVSRVVGGEHVGLPRERFLEQVQALCRLAEAGDEETLVERLFGLVNGNRGRREASLAATPSDSRAAGF